ncbi:MAG: hypothetical protein U9R37_02380 [Campylobacterota bacterium]|nr:hypothetical protein [Campylobacterota bacterium]
MEIGRIFWDEMKVYGADAYGCNKFKIFNYVPPVAWECVINNNIFDVGSVLDEDDLENAEAKDFYIDCMDLDIFLEKWITYFGGLDLE